MIKSEREKFYPAVRMLIVYLVWNISWIIPGDIYYIPYVGNYLTGTECAYLEQFMIIGLLGCVLVGRQKIKEFSCNVLTKHNAMLLLVNAAFSFIIVVIDSHIFNYPVLWAGVLGCGVETIVFNGFVEEWVFRGYFVNQFQKLIPKEKWVVGITAVLFSLMHLPNYCLNTEVITAGGIVYRLLIPLLLGIVLAVIFIRTRNLFGCLLIHGVYNLISYITSGWWMYVCYVIYWIMIVGYILLFCRKKAAPVKY